MSVGLPHDVKGTHMSRFVKILEDQKECISIENFDNLVKWIENPDEIKIGTRMKNHASIYKDENQLTTEQIEQIAKYLLSLKPSNESSTSYNN